MGTWLTGITVFVIAALAVRRIYKDQKSGSACGGGCSGCTQCPANKQK